MDSKKKIIIFVIIIVLLLLMCFMFLNNKKISNKENENYAEKEVVKNNIDDHLTEIYKIDPDYFEREETDVIEEPVESQNYVSDLGI